MQSARYERIDRKFLDTFYRECGREVTLAYTVLNQTNTWAVTFFVAVLGTSLVALVSKDAASGKYFFDYPNPFHWLYLVLAWALLLRFLQRSALALSNMYRWNEIATAVWEVCALPEDHAQQCKLNDELVELVDRLVINWREPRSRMTILWGTLKLMYLFPVAVFAGLIFWGIAVLPRDELYFLGLAIFLVCTLVELSFFISWNNSKRQALRGESAGKFLRLFSRQSSPTPSLNQDGSKVSILAAFAEGMAILLALLMGAFVLCAIWVLFQLVSTD